MKKFWRILAKSLGEKSGNTNEESDKIAIIRLFIVAVIFDYKYNYSFRRN